MAKFVVELPHDEQRCQPVVSAMLERGPEFLSSFDWGCEHGRHTAWGTIEANSEEEARAKLPTSLRQEAVITEVSKKR